LSVATRLRERASILRYTHISLSCSLSKTTLQFVVVILVIMHLYTDIR